MRIRRVAVAVPVMLAAAVAGCTAADPAPDPAPDADRPAFRVCADPNNLPFSNDSGEGFENRLAALLAGELDHELQYTWWPQRRGFIRNTLQAGLCDVTMAAPVGFDPVITTAPYYTSTYVAVWRGDRDLAIDSFDDPALRTLRIGVQIAGDDGANPPPALALSSRGIVHNVVGFTLFGDYAQPNPPARIIDAVAEGAIDLAFVWGPLAGYFAPRAAVPLEMHPSPVDDRNPDLPFSYAIAVGVRRGETAMRDQIDAVLTRRRSSIQALLEEYGVPDAP